eukprot:CAMPEP_0184359912 /NCGR_PEP_ID=MMETSP1089-20130417/122460_1 /TAXON_ID=38269 ORGANISM="Gloeochaete wittrockiana, Strain SAG46.84" /NCGR_SAMPLE_ID=MMETSP1089 /ASSEMBLY_ACC=CAM_ASM_000445 /LENGTH=46 /DNA_ID= /DNA_START= /DNA_END= /DNA_ORIENTATION=
MSPTSGYGEALGVLKDSEPMTWAILCWLMLNHFWMLVLVVQHLYQV